VLGEAIDYARQGEIAAKNWRLGKDAAQAKK
jgi:hypothetical protein